MPDVSNEIKDMEEETIEGEANKQMTLRKLIKTPHLRRPFILVCCLQMMVALTGISAVS